MLQRQSSNARDNPNTAFPSPIMPEEFAGPPGALLTSKHFLQDLVSRLQTIPLSCIPQIRLQRPLYESKLWRLRTGRPEQLREAANAKPSLLGKCSYRCVFVVA